MSTVSAVWIDASCYGCQACANCQPLVFTQPEGKAEILGAVRVDGRTSDNDAEKAALNEHGRQLSEEILEAAAGCPAEAIWVSLAP